MRLRTEIALALGSILAVQVLTSVAAIALLTRMAPVADSHAQALGTAGAWTIVTLGIAGVSMGTLVARGMSRRIAGPLSGIDETLLAAAKGDRVRRCEATEGPPELARIARAVNDLLDQRSAHHARLRPSGADLDRAALLALLDHAKTPVAIVDVEGGVRAANVAAQDLLYGPDGVALRSSLERVPRGDVPGVELLPFEGGWVCRFSGHVADIGGSR